MVAFEVIEHLENWRGFLREARRVLAPTGQFIVSTPNKLYYTESRGARGRESVSRPRIRVRGVPRRAEGGLPARFACSWRITWRASRSSRTSRGTRWKCGWMRASRRRTRSHFFVAVCAHRPQIGQSDVRLCAARRRTCCASASGTSRCSKQRTRAKNEWLDKAQQDLAELDREHQKLLAMFREQKDELESEQSVGASS